MLVLDSRVPALMQRSIRRGCSEAGSSKTHGIGRVEWRLDGAHFVAFDAPVFSSPQGVHRQMVAGEQTGDLTVPLHCLIGAGKGRRNWGSRRTDLRRP